MIDETGTTWHHIKTSQNSQSLTHSGVKVVSCAINSTSPDKTFRLLDPTGPGASQSSQFQSSGSLVPGMRPAAFTGSILGFTGAGGGGGLGGGGGGRAQDESLVTGL